MHGPYARTRLSGTQIPRVASGSVKTATTAAPNVAPNPTLCPRCTGILTDPYGLGLCARCGFCRSIDEGQGTPVLVRASAPAPTVVVWWQSLRSLPDSVWPILIVTLFLLPVCYFADRRLAPVSLERVLWTFLQIGLGLAAIFIAQVWAYLLLRSQGEAVSFSDVFYPTKLWQRTCVALPDTGGPLSLCASGSVVILTAVIWIGGWSWWLDGDTTPDLPTTRAASVENRNWRNQYQQLKTAAADVKNVNPGKPPATPAPKTIDQRPTSQCVVIGYVPDEEGGIKSLVLATLREGKLSYAGTVTDGVSKEVNPGLLKKLAALGNNTPLLSDVDVKALWVRPELFCEVHQSGANDKGLLVAPRFKAVIED